MDYVEMAVTGLCLGFGLALGNYFAQKSFIKHLDKIKLPEGNNGKNK
jgi:uncharacterized protein YneF (UPF0154 family)